MNDMGAASAKRDYALFTLTGAPRIRWKFHDEGIAIEGDQLSWQDGEVRKRASLKNVREVHLQCIETKDGAIGTCVITFRNLAKLTIRAASAHGSPDEERALVYAAFLKDLHDSIVAHNAKDARVDYVGGVSPLRFKVVVGAMIVAIAMFVALPVVLLFITGDSQALWLAAGGAFFVYPLFRSMQRSAPQKYQPDAIPEELLP